MYFQQMFSPFHPFFSSSCSILPFSLQPLSSAHLYPAQTLAPIKLHLFIAVLINIFNIPFSTSGAGFCATNRRLLENGWL